MPDNLKLVQTRIRAGVWQGVLTGAGAVVPQLQVLHLERSLPGLVVTPVPGQSGDYEVKLPIPVELLSEGVQTFLIRQGELTLAHFTIITGVPMEDDLRAEIDLLRAELDMLKRAFRRHCLETAG
ncbi:hypothetical protein Q9295_10895 [Xinfangfangia sp. CPCC 101601]|uniref:Uncharacterized protein n=1 Tax=Pseudogemmobacter lacusdianii TaxID=3069608 RepID=A0ABU0VZC2_9RHOB|nr:hypothetical protein [Xinfangfangia sp. CPCC 101601]MDQ2066883.1 hypothetical protein [Xinfangfangia sp. CPCC 101601]